MREADLHAKGAAWLRKRGFIVIKLTVLGAYGSAGWPDVLVIAQSGYPRFIEWKLPGKDLTPLQLTKVALLRKYGQRVSVVRSLDQLKELMS